MADTGNEQASLPRWGRPGFASRARRSEGVVHRQAEPWSDTVLALLRHLRSEGFTAAPRVIDTGFDAEGAETLEFIEGACPEEPFEWSTDAGYQIGTTLRDLHRAAASFTPPTDAVFRPWFGRRLPGTTPVFGHCDTGPYNIIARSGMPIALIDWEFAGPTDAVWELAQTAWLNAQLHEVAFTGPAIELPSLRARGAVLRAILDGYGLSAEHRATFVDGMVEFIVCSAQAKGEKHGVSPSTSVGVSQDGHPVAWDILWRVKAASWVLRHRSMLQKAIG